MAHRLGLTGGIGSGKSTVAAMLSGYGASVIDADAISRAATGPSGSAIKAIRNCFGANILTEDGALNRDQMRTLIFSNPDAKKQLEAIVHPLVEQAIATQASAADQLGVRCIVFDIPLLVESPYWRSSLHQIIVIDCSEMTQIARVVKRNGLSPTSVEQIMASQAPRLHRLAAADCVVFNDDINLDQLAHEVREISHHFRL